MKLVYEQLNLEEQKRSFLFQRIETVRFDHPWHFHPELELTWIKHGAGVRYIGDHIEHFESNDLILAGSGLPHQWKSFSSEIRSEAFVLQFNHEDLMKIREVSLLYPLFDRARFGISYQITEHLVQHFESLPSGNRLERLSLLIQILGLLLNMPGKELSKRSYSWNSDTSLKSQSIITYIQEHLGDQLTIPEMAERANMAVPSFCRWFKRITGKTFVDFVNSSRVEIATAHLSQEKESIAEVAHRSGFNSISQFNRAFKKHKSMSPKDWRQHHRLISVNRTE